MFLEDSPITVNWGLSSLVSLNMSSLFWMTLSLNIWFNPPSAPGEQSITRSVVVKFVIWQSVTGSGRVVGFNMKRQGSRECPTILLAQHWITSFSCLTEGFSDRTLNRPSVVKSLRYCWLEFVDHLNWTSVGCAYTSHNSLIGLPRVRALIVVLRFLQIGESVQQF